MQSIPPSAFTSGVYVYPTLRHVRLFPLHVIFVLVGRFVRLFVFLVCAFRFLQLSFEFRKVMHMLSIPFLLALCFHTKAVRSMGIVLLVWYLLDRMYFTTRM